MPILAQLIGKRFGRLTAIRREQSLWFCRCDCGGQARASTTSLRSGNTKSCGCYNRERARENHRVHGGSPRSGESVEYKRWKGAKDRCFNPASKSYQRYGGRGITMCAEWAADFASFMRHMGPCPSGYTLDRIDCNGQYSPDNCRWIPAADQAANTRKNIYVTVDGERMTLIAAARRLGLNYSTIQSRVYRGLSPEQAIRLPAYWDRR